MEVLLIYKESVEAMMLPVLSIRFREVLRSRPDRQENSHAALRQGMSEIYMRARLGGHDRLLPQRGREEERGVQD